MYINNELTNKEIKKKVCIIAFHTHTRARAKKTKTNKKMPNPQNNILSNKSNQGSEKSTTMKNLKKEFEEDKGNGMISQLHWLVVCSKNNYINNSDLQAPSKFQCNLSWNWKNNLKIHMKAIKKTPHSQSHPKQKEQWWRHHNNTLSQIRLQNHSDKTEWCSHKTRKYSNETG